MSELTREQIVAGLELLTDSEKREARKSSTVLAVRMAEQRAEYHARVFRRQQFGQPRPEGETPLCKCARCTGA